MNERGWNYDLRLAAPAHFRAHGLDAAHRIARRIDEAVSAALAADREVLEVERRPIFDGRPAACDATRDCRSGLHNRGCPRHRS